MLQVAEQTEQIDGIALIQALIEIFTEAISFPDIIKIFYCGVYRAAGDAPDPAVRIFPYQPEIHKAIEPGPFNHPFLIRSQPFNKEFPVCQTGSGMGEKQGTPSFSVQGRH